MSVKYPGQMIIRCPDEMHAEIKAAAEHRRSMNAEILHRLSTWSEGEVPVQNANQQHMRATLATVRELEAAADRAFAACQRLGIRVHSTEGERK